MMQSQLGWSMILISQATGLDTAAKILDIIYKSVAILAIPVTLWATWLAHQQRTMFEMIDKVYDLCHSLHDQVASNWLLGHLFVIEPRLYDRVKERIAKRCAPDADEAINASGCREKLIEDERHFAIRIFITYEQVYYQWRRSRWLLHRRRKAFLYEMLRYFTDRLLRNPRLLAYLAAYDSGAQLHLEPHSTEHLINAIGRGSFSVADFSGPYEFDPRESSENINSA